MSLLPSSFLPFWWRGEGVSRTPARGQFAALLFFLAICGAAALYASLYAPSGEGNWGWYPRLVKPSWFAPPSVTGPVSALFYAVLAVAIWRIWRTGAFRSIPITSAGFACLLLLQSLWSTLFYGLQSPCLGLADLVCIFLLAFLLWLTLLPIDTPAAWLWSAYLCWTLYLLACNAAVWWLNS